MTTAADLFDRLAAGLLVALIMLPSAASAQCEIVIKGDGVADDIVAWEAIVDGNPDVRWSDGASVWSGKLFDFRGHRIRISRGFNIQPLQKDDSITISNVEAAGRPSGNGTIEDPWTTEPPYILTGGTVTHTKMQPSRCSEPTS